MASSKSKNTKKSGKMSLKKAKLEMEVPDAWVNELETLHVNDTSWNCFVALFVEKCFEGTIYTNKFNEAAINGNRLAVKVISKMVVVTTIIKNTVENSSEHPGTPMALLCHEIYKAVGPDFKKNIPTELLAPLIKYIILEYKEWHKKVQGGINRMEKEFDERQQNLLNLSKVKTPVGKKSQSEEKSVKADKSAKPKVKVFTKLRRRGEEWKDIQWIDDSPMNGPELYILISTFYDANLILELRKLGVPLQAVVKLEYETTPTNQRESMNTDDMLKSSVYLKSSSSIYLSTKVKKETEETISDFLHKLEYLKTNINSALLYKDIMFLAFVLQHIDIHIKEFQENIYKDLSHFLYDAFETTILHQNYLRKMKIINVSDCNVCLLSKMKVYNSILDSVPHEALTIPLILDALLTQVCSVDRISVLENKEGESTTLKSDSENMINETLLKHVNDLNIKYDLFYDQPIRVGSTCSTLLSVSPPEETKMFKIVFQYSDDIKLKTFHFNRELADFLVARSSCVHKTAWSNVLSKDCVSSHKFNNRFNKLCSEIFRIQQEVNHNSLYYYVYLLVINNVINSSLLINCKDLSKNCNRKGHCLVGSNIHLPTNTTSFNGIEKDIIANDMFYIEDMCIDVLLQNIQSIHLDYNKVEKRYCPFTDKVILIYHNIPHYFEEAWVRKLTTQVPLRDFVEYVLDEEKVCLAEMFSEPHDEFLSENINSYSDFQKEVQQKTKYFSDLESQFITHRSIKYSVIMTQKKFQNISRKSSGSSTLSRVKKSKNSLQNVVSEEPNGNKMNPETVYFKENNQQDFKFIGYELGEPMRFQFNGCKKSQILDRNCKVVLETVKQLYGIEYVRLNIRICDHNLFYSHNSESKLLTPFHLVLSSGIVLYFGLPGLEMKHSETTSQEALSGKLTKTQEESKRGVDNITEQEFKVLYEFPSSNRYYTSHFPCEIPFLYKLKMSTPSGLYVELEDEQNFLYVRQTQLSTKCESTNNEREKLRCCLSNGLVLKFLVNGEVVVLGANGEIYVIYSETSSDEVAKQRFYTTDKELKTQETKSNVSREHKEISNNHKTPPELLKENNEYNSSKFHTESLQSILGYNYNFTSSDGKRYEIQGTNIKPLDNLLITSCIDISNNCITSERSDGVTTKHLSDGSLTVKFPDGSRVTSIPTQIEDIFCEWSEEELKIWFNSSIQSSVMNDSIRSKNTVRESANYNNTETNHPSISSFKTNNENQAENDLKSLRTDSLATFSVSSNQSPYNKLNFSQDGFVVYNISYRFEHSKYGLVFFDSNKCQIDFELPQATKVSLQNDGIYKALFDSTSLVVDGNEIYFNKHNKDGDIERSTVINKSTFSKNNKLVNIREGGKNNHPESIESVDSKSINNEDTEVGHITNQLNALFYSKDCFENEMYIDYDLNFHDLSNNSVLDKITDNDFVCFVIDKDLKGFRIVSNNEIHEYLDYVAKNKGLIRESGDTCKCVVSSVGIDRNETEKWLMIDHKGEAEQSKDLEFRAYETTTYGRQGSWCHPFKEKTNSYSWTFKEPDVVVVRSLQQIPLEDVELSYLQRAFKVFKVKVKDTHPIIIPLTNSKGCLNFTDIAQNISILENIYKEEYIKKLQDGDKARKEMKHMIEFSLVRQACIKSRNLRVKMKDEQMKTALRTKAIPPYYLSYFGLVHNILDDVINRVYNYQRTSVTKTKYNRINTIIDSILDLISKQKTILKQVDVAKEITNSANDCANCSDLNNEIKQKLLMVDNERNHENIVNSILLKPLSLVTSEEVDILCKTFEFHDRESSIAVNEELMLQDVLNARQHVTEFFYNLQEMLKCYRCKRDMISSD